LRLVCGVDEAGRGPVIGPLVVAGVLVTEDRLPVLKSMGVRDSKLLTPRRREELSRIIRRVALKVCYVDLNPVRIDEVVFRGVRLQRLNLLEARAMAEVIDRLSPDVAFVDASDVLADRFGRQIRGLLSADSEVVSEHNADENYPVVSAASIMAKVRRDASIARLRERYGDFGCGYPHDPKTRLFLLEWARSHGSYPNFVRKSWKTARVLMSEVAWKGVRQGLS
jgi:ribonuclease HII